MAIPTPQTKQCKSCTKEKPLDAFYAQIGGVLGRRAQCKECYRSYMDNELETLECVTCGGPRSRRSARCSSCDAAEKRQQRATDPAARDIHNGRMRAWRSKRKTA